MSWFAAFGPPREHAFEPLRIEGVLPAELSGTLVRTGPSLFACAGRPYRHWFDGDGAVSAVRFADGRASGAIRVVETPGLLEERRAGRPLYPAYGTLPPGAPRPYPRPKNAANTSLMVWNERWFALHEAGAPVEIARDDLRTIGEADLGCPAIRDGFGAHPHAARGALYNVGIRYGAGTELDVFELRGERTAQITTIKLASASMVHDFAVTDRNLIVFVPPLRLNQRELARGLLSYSEALEWTPALGTEIVILPLDDLGAVTRFTVDPFYQWHFANAFERGSEIVVDFVRYPDFSSNAWYASLTTGQPGPDVRQGRLSRATIAPRTQSFRCDPISDIAAEFPHVAVVDARPHRFVYVTSHSSLAAEISGPQDRIGKVDVESGAEVHVALGHDHYPSEPVFVARGSAEDDGWILSLVYDASSHASYVAVLDAAQLDAAPIARVWFDHHVPFTLHGTWA